MLMFATPQSGLREFTNLPRKLVRSVNVLMFATPQSGLREFADLNGAR